MKIPENFKDNIFYICSNNKALLTNSIRNRIQEYAVPVEDLDGLTEAVAILLTFCYNENDGISGKIKQAIVNIQHTIYLVCFDNDFFFTLYSDYINEIQKNGEYEKGLKYLFELDGFGKKTEDIFYFTVNELVDVTLVPRSVLLEKVSGYADVVEIKKFAEETKKSIENSLNTYIEKINIDNSLDDIFENAVKTPTMTDKCKRFLQLWTPERISIHINKYIAGQEYAVNTFSQMIYEHVVRIAYPEHHIKKSNYVMFGPTGCGKTEIVKIASKILPIPIEVVDASSITSQGFKGLDKEDVLGKLLDKYGDEMEYAIVVLDEFDKLCYKRFASHGDDVNKSIQFDLLKMIEGTTLYVRQQGHDVLSALNTENITFVCAGAFDGAFSADVKNAFGFGAVNIDKKKDKTVIDCLIDFGMVPELAGRISAVIPVRQLSVDDMYEILVQKEDNCIRSIKNLYQYGYNTELEFQESALKKICDIALKQKLGARGLQGIVEAVCHKNLKPNTKLQITEKMVSDVYDTLNNKKEAYSR